MKNKPLKRFGQNYLTDKNTILKIIKLFKHQKYDDINEICPGRGAFTAELTTYSNNITAVEIDNRVIENLIKKFPNVNFLNMDFLKVDFSSITTNSKFRAFGNIPFNLTSSILFKLIENRELFSDAILLVQYDVAKRIISKPRTKEYGILSVVLNYFASITLDMKIPPTVFTQRPKVDTAIINIKFDKIIDKELDDKFFISVIKASFGNRRKTLKNSLNNSIFVGYNLDDIQIDFGRRAETLSIEEFVYLAKELQKRA